MKKPVIVICGPTASGKSATAILVAQAISGEIISADSMQIYRGLDIGTAKVTLEEQQLVPHHLVDCCDPGDYFSVAAFKKMAIQAILDIQAHGHVAIICGGTGQYISSLVEGIDFVEIENNPQLREQLNRRVETEGLDHLYAELQRIDPVSAEAIKPRDQKRIVRALEVYLQTGKKQSEHQAESRLNGPDFDYLVFILNHDRAELYARINKRVRMMFEAGLIDEVRNLVNKIPPVSNIEAGSGEDKDNPESATAMRSTPSTAWQAIGYKEVLAYLRGDQSEQEAAEQIAQSTRRYAKRQLTWFRRFSDAIWIDNMTPVQAAAIIVTKWNNLRQND